MGARRPAWPNPVDALLRVAEQGGEDASLRSASPVPTRPIFSHWRRETPRSAIRKTVSDAIPIPSGQRGRRSSPGGSRYCSPGSGGLYSSPSLGGLYFSPGSGAPISSPASSEDFSPKRSSPLTKHHHCAIAPEDGPAEWPTEATALDATPSPPALTLRQTGFARRRGKSAEDLERAGVSPRGSPPAACLSAPDQSWSLERAMAIHLSCK